MSSILLRRKRCANPHNDTTVSSQWEKDEQRMEARRAATAQRNAGILGRLHNDPQQKERERQVAADEMQAYIKRVKEEAAKRNVVCQYVNEGLCEKARTYLTERISSLLGVYVMDFQRRNQPESAYDNATESKFGGKEEEQEEQEEGQDDGRGGSMRLSKGQGLSMRIIVEEGEEERDDGDEGKKRQNDDTRRIEADVSVPVLSGKNVESMLDSSNLGGLHGGGGSNISAPGSIAGPGDRSWLEGSGRDHFAVPEGSPRGSEVLGITSPREEKGL